MKKYLICAQQVIQYEFEVTIPDDITITEYLSNHTIDHDTFTGGDGQFVTGTPETKDWGMPEYIEIKKLEG